MPASLADSSPGEPSRLVEAVVGDQHQLDQIGLQRPQLLGVPIGQAPGDNRGKGGDEKLLGALGELVGVGAAGADAGEDSGETILRPGDQTGQARVGDEQAGGEDLELMRPTDRKINGGDDCRPDLRRPVVLFAAGVGEHGQEVVEDLFMGADDGLPPV